MPGRKRLTVVAGALVLLLSFPADAACPSPSSSFCGSRCDNYSCGASSQIWELCAYVGNPPAGCMSMVGYSCCDHIQPGP
jgi:hypothetical protein